MLNSSPIPLRARLTIPLVLALSLLAGASHAQSHYKPRKTEDYRPFTISSTKHKRQLPGSYVFEQLLCRSTLDNIEGYVGLLRDFDLLRSSATDGSMSMTTFRGLQADQEVQVTLAVQSSNQVLTVVMVDGMAVFSCY